MTWLGDNRMLWEAMATPASRISLRQMEMLWAILQHGTMGKAAVALNISQPAISRMVRHAEDRTGLQLFERRGSRLVPTPELRVLAEEFGRVFTNVDNVQRLSLALASGWGRPIRVATMSMIADTFLVAGMAAMRRDHPKVPLVVSMNNRGGVEDAVLRENVDIGLVHGFVDVEELSSVRIAQGPVVCLMPQDHALADLSEVAPADLVDVDLIAMGRRSPLSQSIDAVFEDHGLVRQVALQIADSRLAARFVVEGAGVALVDPFFIGSMPLDALAVRPFRPTIETSCYAIFGKRRVLSRQVEHLIAHLEATGKRWANDNATAFALG